MNPISKKLFGFNEILENLLDNFNKNKLSNSIIFYGNEGIGKKTFTFYLINKIFENFNIKNTNLIYENVHPNVRLIEKIYDEKTKSLKNSIIIDQIRQIENFIFHSTIDGLPKFIIVDSADDLNIHSSNSLLKILEEPNKNTYFILLSHKISSLLPTIRSRCIKIKFNNPSKEIFNKILSNYETIDTDKNIDFLFDISNNSPGLSLKFNELNLFQDFDDLIYLFKNNVSLSNDIYEFSSRVSQYNNENFKLYLSLIRFIIINTIKINLGIKINNYYHSYLSNILVDLSQHIDNNISLKILDYLDFNEKNLFIFNLDKRIFNLNLFSSLPNKT